MKRTDRHRHPGSGLGRVRRRAAGLALSVTVGLAAPAPSFSQNPSNEFLLIRRSMPVQTITLTTIGEQHLEHLPPNRSWERVPIDDCIALLNPAAKFKTSTSGMLFLADGQRLPGVAAASAQSTDDSLAWNHPWLGLVQVPLTLIEAAALSHNAVVPPPGHEDVIVLANGDRQEGLIIAWGNSITLESGQGPHKQTTEIPLHLVKAVRMIASKQKPGARRIWFDEGTVLDVQSIAVSEDGSVRLANPSLFSGGAGTQPTRVTLSQIAAVLFDPNGMIPLATLTPARVEGPATRYVLPKPGVVNPEAPLNLSSIEFAGPLVVRYSLPAGAVRFHAEAELPPQAREWGDVELIVRSNDAEVFRRMLNSANPSASINVALPGRELTIELSDGEHGPVQDRLLLHRPMLLMNVSP